MTKLKLSLYIITSIFFSNFLQAQTAGDALRYSQIYSGSTARNIGVGGSMGAFGADFGTLSNNPAGIAAFWKSEFNITPVYSATNNTSTLNSEVSINQPYTEKDRTFNLANIGLVFAKKRQKDWRTVNFGLGVNALNNFRSQSYFSGQSRGSYTDRFLEQANNGDFNDFESNPAIETYAVFKPTENASYYINDFTSLNNPIVPKSQIVNTRGSNSEFLVSFGGNYKDKLLLGMSVGIPIVSYTENKEYLEENTNNLNTAFRYMKFVESLGTEGVGVNLKIGAIYKVNKIVRVGAAVHTPTMYSLSDNYSTQLTYKFQIDNDLFNNQSTPNSGNFNYTLNTPWRLTANTGFLISKHGFLSADMDYVDYSSSSFDLSSETNNAADKEYERQINNKIANDFTSAINIRFGGEYVFDIFRVRAGYGLYGSPYKGNSTFSKQWSLGFGIRGNVMFADLAYQRASNQYGYVPYLTNDAPQQIVNITNNKDQISFTVGIKF